MFNAHTNAVREVLDIGRPPRREPPTPSGKEELRVPQRVPVFSQEGGCLCKGCKGIPGRGDTRGTGRLSRTRSVGRAEQTLIQKTGVWGGEAEPR